MSLLRAEILECSKQLIFEPSSNLQNWNLVERLTSLNCLNCWYCLQCLIHGSLIGENIGAFSNYSPKTSIFATDAFSSFYFASQLTLCFTNGSMYKTSISITWHIHRLTETVWIWFSRANSALESCKKCEKTPKLWLWNSFLTQRKNEKRSFYNSALNNAVCVIFLEGRYPRISVVSRRKLCWGICPRYYLSLNRRNIELLRRMKLLKIRILFV